MPQTVIAYRPSLRSNARPSCYQRCLEIMNAFRAIGDPEDLGFVDGSRVIVVRSRREYATLIAQLRFTGDRYAVEVGICCHPPTEEERRLIKESSISHASIQAFSDFFDLQQLRSKCDTFSPDETCGVLDALDSIFGPKG